MLTFVCMLRCWTWDAVPNWLLYSSVLHVRRYADTATFSQFRTGRKRPLPSLAVGVSAGDVASVRAAVRRCDTAWAAGIGVIMPGAAV